MSDTAIFLLLMIPGTFFLGLNDTLVRKVLRSGKVDQQFLLAFNFLSVAVILSFVLIATGMPEIKEGFWSALFITAGLNIFAQWAWYTAFKREEASLISPLRLLTPPLVILTGFLVLGEKPSLAGIAGIAVTILGLWFLFESEAGTRKARFREVVKRPGVLLALWGAVSFAISFPFDKKTVVASSPLFAVFTAFLIVGTANAFIWCITCRGRMKERMHGIGTEWRTMLLMPFSQAASALLSFAALSYSLAAYAASVKRLWSLWAVILSGAFLKEKNISRKLFAVIIMLGGIVLTVFFG